MKLFSVEKALNVSEVHLGIVGTSNSGKTYLLRAIQKLVLDMYLRRLAKIV